jgi:hypothetical protein
MFAEIALSLAQPGAPATDGLRYFYKTNPIRENKEISMT